MTTKDDIRKWLSGAAARQSTHMRYYGANPCADYSTEREQSGSIRLPGFSLSM